MEGAFWDMAKSTPVILCKCALEAEEELNCCILSRAKIANTAHFSAEKILKDTSDVNQLPLIGCNGTKTFYCIMHFLQRGHK